MTTQINLDDPRVKRTRQLLQQAFMALMMERRFRDITVQEIADRATVNRATFYAHFEDKFDLLDSAIRDRFKQELAAKMPGASTWSEDHLRQLITIVFEAMAMMTDHCAPAGRDFLPSLERAIQEETYAVLLVWFLQPTFPSAPGQVALETLAMLWSWSIFGVATQWSRGARTTPLDEMARQVALILLQSVREVAQG
jgi:AcrR family transcriptional regulator